MVDVPPPPENPFMSDTDHESDAILEESLPEERPNVAAKPERVLAVLGVVLSVLGLLIYLIFFSGGDEAPDKSKVVSEVAKAEPEPPPLPDAPPVLEPPPTIVPPEIPEPTKLQIIQPEEDAAEKQAALARMRSKIILQDGGGSLSEKLSGDSSTKKPVSADPNSQFEANVAATTKAERVESTHIGDLRRTIAQGRLIHATMESALNTDLPAPIRAIVSRDTYGEAGREPLIPKGSRLIGTYNTDISGSQTRVFVVWTRIIRPDGVDIQINSPLVDQIGIAGIGGQVDNKFQSIFGRAIISSVINIAMALGTDKISGGSSTTVTNGQGTTTTGDAATTASINSLNRLGSVSDGFLSRFMDSRPTILVDQGTMVNVFVNRDLVFPPEASKTAKVIE